MVCWAHGRNSLTTVSPVGVSPDLFLTSNILNYSWNLKGAALEQPAVNLSSTNKDQNHSFPPVRQTQCLSKDGRLDLDLCQVSPCGLHAVKNLRRRRSQLFPSVLVHMNSTGRSLIDLWCFLVKCPWAQKGVANSWDIILTFDPDFWYFFLHVRNQMLLVHFFF